MKRILILFPIIVLCGLAFFYLYFRSNLKKPSATTLIYNADSGKWENTYNVPKILREEVDKDPNEDGLHNATILRGYFDHYDDQNSELVMKSVLPFTMNMQYEEVKLKTSPAKVVYCSPSTITDKETQKTYLTKDLRFPVLNNETMKITKEKIIDFNDFLKYSKADTYMFVQLTNDFTKNSANYIKKLVVIGLCD